MRSRPLICSKQKNMLSNNNTKTVSLLLTFIEAFYVPSIFLSALHESSTILR